jgi:hypothetical protein
MSAAGSRIGRCELTGGYVAVADDFDDEARGMRQQINSRMVGLACGGFVLNARSPAPAMDVGCWRVAAATAG